ncbi:hypothetical protein MSG28_008791 [Choristoneura fumiferana]|uniref:Uncharacterized protein n=1 Tax=Choristoneura fumiferana TaxID=7141 RepID=A0ACC0J811_CHOFU|nr:hypothetical protein MSG28_008791 [Choristoneura fumiferana]
MVCFKLFLLKILLLTFLVHIAVAKKTKNDDYRTIATTKNKSNKNYKDANYNFQQKLKLSKKIKRSSYRRQWSSTPADYGTYAKNNNPPPYLVYNRKTGSYYPYYNYPMENNVRRNGLRKDFRHF